MSKSRAVEWMQEVANILPHIKAKEDLEQEIQEINGRLTELKEREQAIRSSYRAQEGQKAREDMQEHFDKRNSELAEKIKHAQAEVDAAQAERNKAIMETRAARDEYATLAAQIEEGKRVKAALARSLKGDE